MVTVKNELEIKAMRAAGKVVAKMLAEVKKAIIPGIKKRDLDIIAARVLKENNAKTAFKGYYGFPNHICVSINNELIHGIANNQIIKTGDLVSIDAGAVVDGYFADAAITVGVGQIKAEYQKLITVTEEALNKAIAIIAPGVRIGTIGATIQQFVEQQGYHLPKNYMGHGIGKQLHEEPYVPNYGKYDYGLKLVAGMTICIEPMLQIGTDETRVLSDNWTVVSLDGTYSAHFEHTILVTAKGYEVLTANPNSMEEGN